ncbi:MAG TPA: hypothetical protein VFC71_11895 [Candidatus Polarisedimenticolia bacterium]|nr:hypothetical protein [Candidatus Polarisedimenticolia bacterium]
MPMSVRLAAAAVIGVIALGVIYLNLPGRGDVAGPSPSPSASPSPTIAASPSASVAPALPQAGPLAPGTYSYLGTNLRVTLTVPSGWEGGGFFVSLPESEAPNGASLGFRQPTVVYGDPCDEGTSRPLDSTVADLVDALANLPHVTDSAQEDVTLSGFSGTHLSFVIDTEGIDCIMALYRQVEFVRAPDNGEQLELWILDVAGTRLVVDVATSPGTSADVRAEMQAMVDTLVIEPTD